MGELRPQSERLLTATNLLCDRCNCEKRRAISDYCPGPVDTVAGRTAYSATIPLLPVLTCSRPFKGGDSSRSLCSTFMAYSSLQNSKERCRLCGHNHIKGVSVWRNGLGGAHSSAVKFCELCGYRWSGDGPEIEAGACPYCKSKDTAMLASVRHNLEKHWNSERPHSAVWYFNLSAPPEFYTTNGEAWRESTLTQTPVGTAFAWGGLISFALLLLGDLLEVRTLKIPFAVLTAGALLLWLVRLPFKYSGAVTAITWYKGAHGPAYCQWIASARCFACDSTFVP